MKKVVRWIVLIWTVFSLPFTMADDDLVVVFFGLLFSGLIISLMISDLKEEE